MAIIRAYTTIEQSRKLVKILPIESADMFYNPRPSNEIPYVGNTNTALLQVPCWSLVALLNVLRTFTTPTAFSVKVSAPSLTKTENGYKLTYTGDYTPMINNGLDVEAPIESVANNAIDCCVNMIILLYELKIL